MIMRLICLLAVLLTALALAPSAAHLLELSAKMRLDRADYFTVQSIYRGWALLGMAVIAAAIANVAAAVLLYQRGIPVWPSLSASVLIVSTLAVFLIWAQPANVATANWSVQPDNWQTLRHRWEYAHAVNAILLALALVCATLAAVRISISDPGISIADFR
jgi:hypothetical protein